MNEKRVIALGFFDGIHLGHQALLKRTTQRAEELGCTPAVISFDTHPKAMIGGQPPALINSPYDRSELIKRVGKIDDVIFLHFDSGLMRMTWEQFLDTLISDFGAVHLVAGYNFRFGYRGEGTTELLREKCAELGIGLDIIEQVQLEGVPVSSTYIRELLEAGNMLRATQFLGHAHVLTDFVRYGYRFGRTLGMPTINQRFTEGVLVPKKGVYAAKVYISTESKVYNAVTNIGTRPTVSGGSAISCESHIIGFSGNLYGHEVRVEFYKYLRPERKFETPEALREQVMQNVEEAKIYFSHLEK